MTTMSSFLDYILPYVVTIVDSDDKISETELSEEATNYDTEISLSRKFEDRTEV